MPEADWLPPEGHPVRRKKTSGVYDTPHGTYRSVTTIIGAGVPKPALPHWYGRTVAACAIGHLPYLSRLRGRPAREAAFVWLKNAAERVRDDAADLGSAIHRHAEARVLGTPMPEPTEEQAPFLVAFDHFLDDFKPSFEATELVVANPAEGYAGTADAWLRLRGLGFAMLLIDYKTGRGVWPEAALQESAYARATVAWTRSGLEVEPPRAERAFVLHLRPDTYQRGYGLREIDIGDHIFAQFKHAQAIDAGRVEREAAIGDPVAPFPLPDLPDLPDPRKRDVS